MRHSWSLELGWCLSAAPVILREFSQVDIQGFSYEWAGGNGAIACAESFALPMPLVQNYCMGSVHFVDGSNFYFTDDSIDKEDKVFDSGEAAMKIMSSRKGVEVGYTWSDFFQQ